MLADVFDYLANISRSKFYGTVELVFQAGRLVQVKETRSMKPEDGLLMRLVLPDKGQGPDPEARK